jgi:hypothetical protein
MDIVNARTCASPDTVDSGSRFDALFSVGNEKPDERQIADGRSRIGNVAGWAEDERS